MNTQDKRIPSLPGPEARPPVMVAQQLSNGRWQARVRFHLVDGGRVEQHVAMRDSRRECLAMDPLAIPWRNIDRSKKPRVSRTPWGRWQCRVYVAGEGKIYVGTFDTREKATEAGWERLLMAETA